MTETQGIQPVAGSLAAVVLRACRQQDCPHFERADCPDHATREDLGVVASFDHREGSKAQ